MDTSDKINIRPTSSVYGTYKRLSYQPWTAIAEFVDNSTQSFFDHKEELECCKDFNKLIVNVCYECHRGGKDTLTITDNAYGMELDDFTRAIVLDSAPENTGGRNEFGMGLKTAACWFGSRWSVESTRLGSSKGYHAVIDVAKLVRDHDEEIDLQVVNTSPAEHYTKIKIENLHKKITGGRTIGKVKDLLSSMYRQDIATGKVEIYYNDTKLNYHSPGFYEEENDDGTKKIWKRDVDFIVEHEGNNLEVSGYIALMKLPANAKEAGLTLLRRGRVIIGGPDSNYRPFEIFGDSRGFAYQRLFGELHLDNWPVTQAKDCFDWHSSGLEENFIAELLTLTRPFRQKAEIIRVRQKIDTSSIIDNTIRDLEQSGVIKDVSSAPISGANGYLESPSKQNPESTYESNGELATENRALSSRETILSGPNQYRVNLQYAQSQYSFLIDFDQMNPNNSWVIVSQETEDSSEIKITINVRHIFFMPYAEKQDFMIVMTKLVMALVLAELESMVISTDGKIYASDIRRKMNDILEKLTLQGVVE